ncbi:hypothetical protein [Kingella potus]|uniref:hypothetical protein n=1 Tax=Kingella potus TaxID=265175 RepID=UPI001FD247FB|nr:hypothetical protein [Kingella potus]UOO99907.1 hypothetical protein LVJ84_07490 [Kingella potus]
MPTTRNKNGKPAAGLPPTQRTSRFSAVWRTVQAEYPPDLHRRVCRQSDARVLCHSKPRGRLKTQAACVAVPHTLHRPLASNQARGRLKTQFLPKPVFQTACLYICLYI